MYTGAHQGIWQIAATWGGAVALAAYSTAGISGAHLNPAVTLALVAFKGFPVAKVCYLVITPCLPLRQGAELRRGTSTPTPALTLALTPSLTRR